LNTLITVKAPTVEAKIDAAKAKLQQAIDTATSKGNTVRADRLRTRLTKLDGKEATLQAKLTAAKDLYAARGCTPTS
jgi:hypothetical protein